MLPSQLSLLVSLLPALLMLAAVPGRRSPDTGTAWRRYRRLSCWALASSLLTLAGELSADGGRPAGFASVLALTMPGACAALLVQLLGTVIGSFSSRYLEGEPNQRRYLAAFAGVLAAVHVLLLADHWLVLIAAWASAGWWLQRLLCFYGDRPFALLAARKKRLADRVADILLLAAAALAWHEVGSGSFVDLRRHLESAAPSGTLQASAICLAMAVVLRTALFPLHGWLIQVMEAPTPVSALLHAGVINLSGFLLVRLSPLLDAAPSARWLLAGIGLATATLAGMVTLTRVSIKVRLAWSTVAQMGFMIMECGLGLYRLAFLHMVGHAIYKAHAFLTASTSVSTVNARTMRGVLQPSPTSLIMAPVASAGLLAVVLPSHALSRTMSAWPWWWSGVLALAWAPLLWQPSSARAAAGLRLRGALTGAALEVALAMAALIGHQLPLGVDDAPDEVAGPVALAAMTACYVIVALLHARPRWLASFRRWSYAGFYLDDLFTRTVLRLRTVQGAAFANR